MKKLIIIAFQIFQMIAIVAFSFYFENINSNEILSVAPIALAIPAIISAGSSIYGSWKASRSKDKEQGAIDDYANQINDTYSDQIDLNNQRLNETNNYYNTLMGKNYFDRAEIQSSLAKLRETQKENRERLANEAAITGASEEMQLAQRANQEKQAAETISELGGRADISKDQLRNEAYNRRQFYENMQANLAQGKMSSLAGIMGARAGMAQQDAAGWSNFAGGAMNAASTLGAAYLQSLGAKSPDVVKEMGETNKGNIIQNDNQIS